eukprot:scaffold646_cov367-Prasinococcus_capsulatus_cf.AAC.6
MNAGGQSGNLLLGDGSIDERHDIGLLRADVVNGLVPAAFAEHATNALPLFAMDLIAARARTQDAKRHLAAVHRHGERGRLAQDHNLDLCVRCRGRIVKVCHECGVTNALRLVILATVVYRGRDRGNARAAIRLLPHARGAHWSKACWLGAREHPAPALEAPPAARRSGQ